MNRFGLEFVKKLRPCTFRFKNLKDDRVHLGFIAQDIDNLLPKEEFAVVTETKNHQFGDGTYLALDKSQLLAPLVKAIQELSNQVDKLEEENRCLRDILQSSTEETNGRLQTA